ncbi:amino acid adenylation domain-containing protein [Sorangium sp. So ce375]|uniref:amino acid adenylation domain-containing protein n=1 Tax=Sorangium sp. So ce375 TaxID=3133306 RepID=UPI003F5B6C7C
MNRHDELFSFDEHSLADRAYWLDKLSAAPPPPFPDVLGGDRQRASERAVEVLPVPVALHRRWLRVTGGDLALAHAALVATSLLALRRYNGGPRAALAVPAGEDDRGLVSLAIHENEDFGSLLERTRAEILAAAARARCPWRRVASALEEAGVNVAGAFSCVVAAAGIHPPPAEPAALELRLAFDAARAEIRVEAAAAHLGPAVRFAAHALHLLDAGLRAPSRPLHALPDLPPDELASLARWNATERSFGPDRCLHELFREQALRTPARIAVADEDGELDFATLEGLANGLAHELRASGVRAETLVGVCLHRSRALVVALLAVLKAGGAYVPLDPELPPERLSQHVADAGIDLLLTSAALRDELGLAAARVAQVDDLGALAQRSAPPGTPELDPGGLAYVIFTSGSTGRPKGAMNTHRAICNRLSWMQAEYGLTDEDRVLHKTSIGFDVSVWELFWPLITGARLELCPRGQHRDPSAIARLLAARSISTVHFVPSLLDRFLQAGPLPELPRLRRVVCSGEALSTSLADAFFARLPAVSLHNLYGPTEAAVDVTAWACRRGEAPVPIGRPIANTRIHLLDPHLRPVPIGAPGELCIGGVAVGRGYIRAPSLTAGAFVPDPFAAGARLYRTGDLARLREDGAIEVLGRIDHQIKIQGVRIEPAEIEDALRAHPSVSQAAVVARAVEGKTQLMAYVVAPSTTTAAELRAHLAARLLPAMIPASFVHLAALPLTASGKLDRRALPEPAGVSESRERPATPTELRLAAVWSEVLRVEAVARHDDFFALGGDSIAAMRVAARAAEVGLLLSTRLLLAHSTLASVALALDAGHAHHAEQGTIVGEAPLSPVQAWFFEQRLPRPEHHNLGLLVAAPGSLSLDRLAAALRALVAHHDALRLRFSRGPEGVRQRFSGLRADEGALAEIDLAALPRAARAESLRAALARLNAGLRLEDGPLWAALLIRDEGGAARLALVAHHLLVDVVSWRVLLQDLARALAQLDRGEAVVLPAKTTSYRYFCEALEKRSQSPEILEELEHWGALERLPCAPLPRDREGENTEASAEHVELHLAEEPSRIALLDVPTRLGASPLAVLVATLAGALAPWVGEAGTRIDLERHGREELSSEVNLSRTVGWFTAIVPLALDLRGLRGEGAVSAADAALREVPGQGHGFALLRHLRGDAAIAARLARLPPADILLNYLGNIDDLGDVASTFRLLPEEPGPLRAGGNPRSHVLEIGCSLQGGCLRLRITYSAALNRRETIVALGERWLAQLAALAGAPPPPDRPPSPNDFPDADLDAGDLTRLLARLPRQPR